MCRTLGSSQVLRISTNLRPRLHLQSARHCVFRLARKQQRKWNTSLLESSRNRHEDRLVHTPLNLTRHLFWVRLLLLVKFFPSKHITNHVLRHPPFGRTLGVWASGAQAASASPLHWAPAQLHALTHWYPRGEGHGGFGHPLVGYWSRGRCATQPVPQSAPVGQLGSRMPSEIFLPSRNCLWVSKTVHQSKTLSVLVLASRQTDFHYCCLQMFEKRHLHSRLVFLRQRPRNSADSMV